MKAYEFFEDKVLAKLWDKDSYHFHISNQVPDYANNLVLGVWALETSTTSSSYRKLGAKHCLARMLTFSPNKSLKGVQRFQVIQIQASTNEKTKLIEIVIKKINLTQKEQKIQTNPKSPKVFVNYIIQNMIDKFEKKSYLPSKRNCYHVVAEIFLCFGDMDSYQIIMNKLSENKRKTGQQFYKKAKFVVGGLAAIFLLKFIYNKFKK